MFQLALLVRFSCWKNRVMTKNRMNRPNRENHLLIVLIYVADEINSESPWSKAWVLCNDLIYLTARPYADGDDI